jgi:hypothetical protein
VLDGDVIRPAGAGVTDGVPADGVLTPRATTLGRAPIGVGAAGASIRSKSQRPTKPVARAATQ